MWKFERVEVFVIVLENSEIMNDLRDCMMLKVVRVYLKLVVINLR